MEVESRQAEALEQFVALGKSARGRAAAELISHATSHPSLFAFAELLSMPNIGELQNTEFGSAYELLRLFAYGTWSDYRSNASIFAQMVPQQVLKLKQLTVLTLAENTKVLPYELLMQELEISNVRDLEDMLINDCMYAGIVRGKLDQNRRCFEVNYAAGRDLRPGQLENMIQTLGDWISNSESLLVTIQDKIKWADQMGEFDRRHKKDVAERAEAVRKCVKADTDIRGHQEFSFLESGPVVMNYMDEDRVRPKRYSKKRFPGNRL